MQRKILGWDIGLRPVGERNFGEFDVSSGYFLSLLAVSSVLFAFMCELALFRECARFLYIVGFAHWTRYGSQQLSTIHTER